jgi:hypothetical protein
MTKWAFEELLIPSVVSERFFGRLMSNTTNLCIAFIPLLIGEVVGLSCG